jgi:hypothetical protein
MTVLGAARLPSTARSVLVCLPDYGVVRYSSKWMYSRIRSAMGPAS